MAPLFACIVAISPGSSVGTVGVVVCFSRLTVIGSFGDGETGGEEKEFSLLFFAILSNVVESDCDEDKFFACNAGFDASTIFLNVS
jgi:hypothetical protein